MSESVIRSALSGMLAATKRVSAAAQNIANSSNVTRLEPKAGDAPAFAPLLVTQSAQVIGGVKADFRTVDPTTLTVPGGNSPLADANGLVGIPNVDLAQQQVDTLVAQRSFEANLKTIQAAQDMQAQLLKIKT